MFSIHGPFCAAKRDAASSILAELQVLFEQHSKEMDDQTLPYNVLDPEATAVSILI